MKFADVERNVSVHSMGQDEHLLLQQTQMSSRPKCQTVLDSVILYSLRGY